MAEAMPSIADSRAVEIAAAFLPEASREVDSEASRAEDSEANRAATAKPVEGAAVSAVAQPAAEVSAAHPEVALEEGVAVSVVLLVAKEVGSEATKEDSEAARPATQAVVSAEGLEPSRHHLSAALVETMEASVEERRLEVAASAPKLQAEVVSALRLVEDSAPKALVEDSAPKAAADSVPKAAVASAPKEVVASAARAVRAVRAVALAARQVALAAKQAALAAKVAALAARAATQVQVLAGRREVPVRLAAAKEAPTDGKRRWSMVWPLPPASKRVLHSHGRMSGL